MLWPKKNSYKEFEDEQKFLRLDNSPPQTPPPPPPPPNLPPLRLQFLGFHPLLFTNSTWILESLTEFTCARVVTRGLRFIGLIHYVGSTWGRCRVDVG